MIDAMTSEPRLTPRELEVLRLAADGASTAELGEQLGISPATVKSHFESAYAKLGARNRAGAVAAAFRRGLIS